MRKAVYEEIYKLAQKNKNVVFIGSDLGRDVLRDFKNRYPSRFFMEGVTEGHLISMAAGMAMEGKIVYVSTIAPFFVRRAFEQIVVDIAMHKLPVRIIGIGGGLVYAPLGPTHMVVEDLATMRAVPNMSVVAVSDSVQMRKLIPQTLNYKGPIYIRLAKGGDEIVTSSAMPFSIGRATEFGIGKDVYIITCGVTLQIALEARKTLLKNGCSVGILHFHTLKPFDEKALLRIVKKVNVVVTVEEGVQSAGLAGAVAETITHHADRFVRVVSIGIGEMYPDRYGSQQKQFEYFGITAQNLVKTVKKAIRWKK